MNLTRQLAALKYGVIPRKPAFMARMLGFYARSFIVKGARQPLRYVDFAVDYACNLHCQHCFATAFGKSKYPRLTVEDYGRIAQECRDLGAIHLSLQGGEATMLPDLPEIITAMRPGRSLFSITTNGTLVTWDLAFKLRMLGVDQLNVSVDSWDSDVHDTFRGKKGAWSATMNGINRAQEAGLHVQINTTVSKSSLYSPGFKGMVDWVNCEMLILNIVLAAPAGNWTGNTDELLSAEDMKVIRALVHSSPYIRQDMDSIQLGRGCPAMKEAIYITPYGDVLCCPFIHVSFGNLHDRPLKEIVDEALRYEFLRTHAGQCLAAEEHGFISRYISQLKDKTLPAKAKEIFDHPWNCTYECPPAVTVEPSEIGQIVADWRARCK